MMSDEYLVECNIDDDDDYDEEVMKIHPTPTPPLQFCSSSQVSMSHGETRDLYGVNNHLRMEFSEVLAEPASLHSFERVWVYSSIGFESARIWSYAASQRCSQSLFPASLAVFLHCCLACTSGV